MAEETSHTGQKTKAQINQRIVSEQQPAHNWQIGKHRQMNSRNLLDGFSDIIETHQRRQACAEYGQCEASRDLIRK